MHVARNKYVWPLASPSIMRNIVVGIRVRCLLHPLKQYIAQQDVVKLDTKGQVIHNLTPLTPGLRDRLRRIANPVNGVQIMGAELGLQVLVDLQLSVHNTTHMAARQQSPLARFPT